jgi:hypothetical protein
MRSLLFDLLPLTVVVLATPGVFTPPPPPMRSLLFDLLPLTVVGSAYEDDANTTVAAVSTAVRKRHAIAFSFGCGSRGKLRFLVVRVHLHVQRARTAQASVA